MDSKLNNKKGKKMVNTSYTENEKKALHLVNQSIFDNGHSWEDDPEHGYEHWEWVTLPQMIELLVSEGWSIKSAEGTIGSIVDKDRVFTYAEDQTDEGEKLFISRWTNVYNDEIFISAKEAEILTNKGMA